MLTCTFVGLNINLQNMKYIRAIIRLPETEEWKRDLLTGNLSESGFDGFVETEAGMDAYIPTSDFNDNLLPEIADNLNGIVDFTWEVQPVEDKNWNEEWEKNYFEPILISDRCVVRAPFHSNYPVAKYEIVIEPNMAFGTGNHETTAMMMEAILDLDFKNKKVLDMGCGTGILAILASYNGASEITAIDIDEWSVNGTMENMKTNHAPNIKVLQGGAEILGFEKYDVVLANIQRNVLLADMEKYNEVLLPGGIIIMSGYYNADNKAIIEKARSLGLEPVTLYEKNNWVAQSFRKL